MTKETPLTAEQMNKKAKGTPFEDFAKDNYPTLSEIYSSIDSILRKYMDLREDYYNIITLWIIGTYFHKEFPTYPFLFFNAMKGSGKTRLINLTKEMVWKGDKVTNLSEATLFRMAKESTLLIDEVENITGKDKATLRQLLNGAYKKGVTVPRAEKVKKFNPETKETREVFEIVKHDVYCPIIMANIWGMENVLADRCITLILEKSDDSSKTKLLEDFDQNPTINRITQSLTQIQCSKCMNIPLKHIDEDIHTPTSLHTTLTLTTLPTQTTLEQMSGFIGNYISKWNEYIGIIYGEKKDVILEDTVYLDMFNKIIKSGMESRNLELFFPLLVLAHQIGPEILNETLRTAEKIIEERKNEDIAENRDIAMIEFLSKRDITLEFIPLSELTNEFRNYIVGEFEEGDNWLNPKWVGRSLRRLNLVLSKRRVSKGIEVLINFAKAKEKIKMFKNKSKDVPEE